MSALHASSASPKLANVPPGAGPSAKEPYLTRTLKIALPIIASLAGFLVLPFEAAIALTAVVTIGAVYCFSDCANSSASPPSQKSDAKATPRSRTQSHKKPNPENEGSPVSSSAKASASFFRSFSISPSAPRAFSFGNMGAAPRGNQNGMANQPPREASRSEPRLHTEGSRRTPSEFSESFVAAPPVPPSAWHPQMPHPMTSPLMSQSDARVETPPPRSHEASRSNAGGGRHTLAEIFNSAQISQDKVLLNFNTPEERLAFERKVRVSIHRDFATSVPMESNSPIATVQLSQSVCEEIARRADNSNRFISMFLIPDLRRMAEADDMGAPPFPREDLHVPEMRPHPMASASMLQSAAPLDSPRSHTAASLDSPRSHSPRSNPRGPQPGIIEAINLATTEKKYMHLRFSSPEERLLFENSVRPVITGDPYQVLIAKMGPKSENTVLQVEKASALEDGGQNVREEYWAFLRVKLKEIMGESA
jgi:hypothetical protein